MVRHGAEHLSPHQRVLVHACGWLLLATIQATRAHPMLPRPGSRRRRLPWKRNRATAAGIAHQLAETLALAMALGLLDRTP